MKLDTNRKLLKVFCMFIWLVLIWTLMMSVFWLIPSASQWVYWSFWGLVIVSIPLLFGYQKKFEVEILKRESLAPGNKRIIYYIKLYFKFFSGGPKKIGASILFIFLNALIIIESYLFIEGVVFVWLLFFFLSFYAILKDVSPDDNIIAAHINFIGVLNTGILLFVIFAFSHPLHKHFDSSIGWMDQKVFSDFAAFHGNNYDGVLEEKMYQRFNVGDIEKSLPDPYLRELNIYKHRLEKKLLGKELFPAKKPARWDKSIHDTIVTRSMESFIDNRVGQSKKNQVMEELLSYLNAVVRMGHLEQVNQDANFSITPLFLERLLAFFQTGQLSLVPGVRQKLEAFYQSLREANKNAYELGKFLGKEEPTP